MPKKVDPDVQRRRIADALIRVTAERGLEAVSLRHVASEAGATAGMVQHYFATKDEMIGFALEVVHERSQARIEAALAHLDTPPTALALLPIMLGELLPTDEERLAEARLTIGVLTHFASSDTDVDPFRDDARQWHEFIQSQIVQGQNDGMIRPDRDPEHETHVLLALLEGLGLHLLSRAMEPDAAIRTLQTHLGSLFAQQTPTDCTPIPEADR